MIYKSLNQLAERVLQSNAAKRIVAVIAAEDGHTLEAVIHAADKGIVTPLLLGRKAVVEEELRKLDANPAHFNIEHAETPEEAARAAGFAIKDGRADFLMKGLIPTGLMLKTLFAEETGFRVGSLVSHMSIVDIPNHHKLVTITDAAINIRPELEQKKVIIENAVRVLHRLGMENPKVAVLASTEQPNPKMPETLDGAELKAMNQRGEITGCIVEGPLPYDLAMCKESAAIKGVQSPVYGDADLLVCHDIAAANSLLKALRHSANAGSAGIVAGGKAPIVLTSRAAAAQDKYWPMVLAASATL